MAYSLRPSFKKYQASKILILVLLLSLVPRAIESETRNRWVVWNVGQGSWITRMEGNECLHFDAGGDRPLPKDPIQNCKHRKNHVIVSHPDWDHISYLRALAGHFRDLCIQGKKHSKVSFLKACEKSKSYWVWHTADKVKSTNDSSGVYYYKGLLYPGDSPKKFEKHWLHSLPEKPRLLVLAHHGSRTGTSEKLLETLGNLKMAIVSARKEKYGHPHQTVQARLKDKKIPLLRTQSWGNLHFLD